MCIRDRHEDVLIPFVFKPKSDLLDDGKHILHKEILEEIAQQVHQQDVQKVKVEEKEIEVRPPLPFNLAKLQAHMNTCLLYTSSYLYISG